MIERKTTKDLLILSLIELSQTMPIDKLTVKDICSNCHLSRSSFYHHFWDKDDIIAEVYRREISQIASMEGVDVTTLILHTLKVLELNKLFYVNAIKHSSGPNSFVSSACRNALAIARSQIQNTHNILSPEIEVAMELYFSGISHVMNHWLLNGMPIPAVEFATHIANAAPSCLQSVIKFTI